MTKTVIRTDRAPVPAGPYSQAIAASGLVFVAGQLGIDPTTRTPSEGIGGQTKQALLNVKRVLEASGSSLAKAVKISVFLRDMNDFREMNEAYKEFFHDDPPARTTIQAPPPGGYLVEIDAIAVQ
ncbi:MAG: reactive intermediate/imine deaminase [Nitrososphaerota archaeon]|nr:reactive intermediate/imine deaminase [Nitrososphaerota archaeon]